MKAEEENVFQSKKTDASLYNGQPTDTGTQCHSVGSASNTPSIPKDKDGVSVENVHTPNKQWFALRVSYGSVLKTKEIIDALNIKSKLSDKVTVANGNVEDLIARVARIACKKRVTVEFSAFA